MRLYDLVQRNICSFQLHACGVSLGFRSASSRVSKCLSVTLCRTEPALSRWGKTTSGRGFSRADRGACPSAPFSGLLGRKASRIWATALRTVAAPMGTLPKGPPPLADLPTNHRRGPDTRIEVGAPVLWTSSELLVVSLPNYS